MGFVPSLHAEKIAVVSRHSAIQAHAGKRSGQHTKVYNVMGFMRTHCGVSHHNQSQLKGILYILVVVAYNMRNPEGWQSNKVTSQTIM